MPSELGTGSGLSFFGESAPTCSGPTPPAPSTRPTGDGDGPEITARPGRRRRVIAALAVSGVLAGLVARRSPSSALADPSANDWYRLRVCESGDNYSINTGNGHYGAYQFDLATWRSVGGSGLPSSASPAEQDARALALYRSRGWQPWQCATILGLRSGTSTTTTVTTPTPVPRSSAPTYPGRSFSYGQSGTALATWQRQMRARGATLLTGTGYYGPNTELVVKALQQQNGLAPLGLLGPQTWALAWTGTFVPSTQTRGGPVRVAPWAGHTLAEGSWNSQVASWQKQMRVRGATTVTGTGEFGPKTVALVRALQQQNHRPVTGVIDATTWTLAWTGSFHT